MVREEGASALTRGMGPNVFRAILMNASQLASYVECIVWMLYQDLDRSVAGTTFSSRSC